MPTIKEDFLHGTIPTKTNNVNIIGAVDFARQFYKKDWTQNKICSLNSDFNKVLNKFTHIEGRINEMTDRIVIISQNLFMLEHLDYYQKFLAKWYLEIKDIKQDIVHPKDLKTKYSIDVNFPTIFGSLFILDQAKKGNRSKVLEMYSIISNVQLNEINLTFAHDIARKKSAQKAAQADRRKPYTKLIEHILKENPNTHLNSIFKRLNYQTVDDKKICIIKYAINGKNGYIQYYPTNKSKKTKSVDSRNFAATVSKVRKTVKK